MAQSLFRYKFYNDICKYGKKNFRYGVIKSCASRAELGYWEKFFIILLGSKAPKGYNLTDGGEGLVGRHHSPETLAKISARKLGKKRLPEVCAKISASKSGANHPWYGKKLPLETGAKVSIKNAPTVRLRICCRKWTFGNFLIADLRNC